MNNFKNLESNYVFFGEDEILDFNNQFICLNSEGKFVIENFKSEYEEEYIDDEDELDDDDEDDDDDDEDDDEDFDDDYDYDLDDYDFDEF